MGSLGIFNVIPGAHEQMVRKSDAVFLWVGCEVTEVGRGALGRWSPRSRAAGGLRQAGAHAQSSPAAPL